MTRKVYENHTPRSKDRAKSVPTDPNRTKSVPCPADRKPNKTRKPDGTFAPDRQVADPGLQAAGTRTQTERARTRRRTERTFLHLLIQEFGAEDVREIARKVKERALSGDKDALAWVGKYMFGGGKVSLDELAHPPMIRKSRR